MGWNGGWVLRQGEARGLSEDTLRSVRVELDRWGCWLKRRQPRPSLEQVDGELLIQYIKSRTRFHAKATVAGVVSKMRGLGDYLLEQGVWAKNPMRWVRGPRLDPRGRLPRRIGKEQMKQIWEAAGQRRNRYQQHLAVAVLALLYGTGLRRGELERLNLMDWHREEGVLRIDGRKTGRERSVPVTEAMGRCLDAYLPQRQNLLEKLGLGEEPAMFLNRYGVRMSAQSLALLMHRLAKQAGVPLVSLHQFRHTCASDLLEGGVSLPEVQQILGHATVVTTARYLQIADPERVRAMRQHPLNDYLMEVTASERRAA